MNVQSNNLKTQDPRTFHQVLTITRILQY